MQKQLRLAAILCSVLAVPAFAQAPTTTPPTAASPGKPGLFAPPGTGGTRPLLQPPSTSAAPGAAGRPAAGPAATAPATATSSATTQTGSRIDVNSATEEQLDTLPGIGAARAKAIVGARPYSTTQELVSKKAITQPIYDGLKDKVAVANINVSSAADMAKVLTGVGDARASAIVKGRPYTKPQDLVSKGVLTQSVYDGIKDQITY